MRLLRDATCPDRLCRERMSKRRTAPNVLQLPRRRYSAGCRSTPAEMRWLAGMSRIPRLDTPGWLVYSRTDVRRPDLRNRAWLRRYLVERRRWRKTTRTTDVRGRVLGSLRGATAAGRVPSRVLVPS